MKARFVTAGGVRTRVLEAGQERPIILIHGIGMSADSWFLNVDSLAAEGAVVAPDLIGHGFSEVVDLKTRDTYEATVQQIADLVVEGGWKSTILVGSSFGGAIALLTYQRFPDRIGGLVLVGSGSAFYPNSMAASMLQESLANGRKAVTDPSWDACARRLAAVCFSESSVPRELILGQMTAYARPEISSFYVTAMLSRIEAHRQERLDIPALLPTINCPVLIINGQNDPRSDPAYARAAVDLLPNAELSLFDDCGHLPYIEYPEEFNTVVLRFLKEID